MSGLANPNPVGAVLVVAAVVLAANSPRPGVAADVLVAVPRRGVAPPRPKPYKHSEIRVTSRKQLRCKYFYIRSTF